MATKLPPEEMKRTKTDFDPPTAPQPEEKKNMKKALRASLSPKPKAAAAKKPEPEKKENEKPKHAGGRPKKAEEVSVRSFRLPDRTVQRLRVLAALKGVSAADVIIELADKVKVPGLDK